MAWPYSAGECPRCAYHVAFEREHVGDDGYRLIGLCRHPNIAAELFVMNRPARESCPCFFPIGGLRPGEQRDSLR